MAETGMQHKPPPATIHAAAPSWTARGAKRSARRASAQAQRFRMRATGIACSRWSKPGT